MSRARVIGEARIEGGPMDKAEKIGGSAAHDQRREGAVTPPEHNLKRSAGTMTPTEQRLEDPDGPHGEPSGRERRRAEERAED